MNFLIKPIMLNITNDYKQQTHQHGYTVIELLLVVMIICILAATQLEYQQQHLHQSRILNVISFAKQAQDDIVEHYTCFGNWPEEEQQLRHELHKKDEENRARSLQEITLGQHGSIHIWFNDAVNIPVNGPILTLRPVLAGTPGPGLISWVCGYGVGPGNAPVLGENKTNIPNSFLPNHCQGKP